jgi:hypothetical protein
LVIKTRLFQPNYSRNQKFFASFFQKRSAFLKPFGDAYLTVGLVIKIEKEFTHLIEFRHGIVHRFEIDTGLEHAQIIEFYETTLAIMDTFLDYIEKSTGFPGKERYDGEEAEEEK